jgi:ATP-dependent DNA ligase
MKHIEFCIPTAGKAVPSGPDWIHEVKYDGYLPYADIALQLRHRFRLAAKGTADLADPVRHRRTAQLLPQIYY